MSSDCGILLHWTKKHTGPHLHLKGSSWPFLSSLIGNQEPQPLTRQRIRLRKGSLWIPDGNSRWGNPGVVRSAKFLWLGATTTILTSHLSTSVSTSQVTSCSEYPRVSLPWYPGQWGDTVKSHLPTWQNWEKTKVKQGLWEKGEQGQGHHPSCLPALLSKASLETIF